MQTQRRWKQGKKGQMEGSYPLPVRPAKLANPLPSVKMDDEFPLVGDVADIDALHDGWLGWAQTQPRDDAADAFATRLTDEGEVITWKSNGGLRYAIEDAQVEAFLQSTDFLQHEQGQGRVPNEVEAATALARLRAELASVSAELDAAEYELARRLDDEGITKVSFMGSGVAAVPFGSFRYASWQHASLVPQVASALVRSGRVDVTEEESTDILNRYALRFALPANYRPSALRDLGIDARDYAVESSDGRRIWIQYASKDDAPSHQTVSLTKTLELAERESEVREALAGVRSSLSTAVQHHDASAAAASYVAMRQRVSLIRQGVQRLESVTARLMEQEVLERVVTDDGEELELRRGRAQSHMDTAQVRPHVIAAVARDAGLPPEKVAHVIEQFETVAHVKTFRRKAVAEDTDIDVDEFISITPGRTRVAAATGGGTEA